MVNHTINAAPPERLQQYMAEHNSVLKLLKDGKLSEKPYAGGKSDIDI